MTASNYVYLVAMVVGVFGWAAPVCADPEVTVVSTAASKSDSTQAATAADGTPVVHKSLHKKKHVEAAPSAAATATTALTPPAATTSAPAAGVTVEKPSQKPPTTAVTSPVVVTGHSQTPPAGVTVTARQPSIPTAPVKPPPAISPTNIAVVKSVPLSNPTPIIITGTANSVGATPLVETGLPVGHYTGVGTPIKGVSTYAPTTTTHPTYFASTIPSSIVPLTSVAAGSFSAPSVTKPAGSSTDFVFTNFTTKKAKISYPWRTGIITTEFWIGEGGSSISSTDNVASAWDENWRSTNRGTDSPYDRNGFASGGHASTVNPFYVALPFNDLAFPDKARVWVPRSWHRRPGDDGKPVSACKDRWVWIKNSNGRSCFAQWEDVGPLRYDHAEYVFGNERPDTYTRAGLDVSPAVAQYLGIDENKKAYTSWRFVDDEDVPPGQWLKYDEQAVIFTALHQLKSSASPSNLPIQKATEPIDDQENDNSNKRKLNASKG
jgi:hypothetical protein